MEESKKDKHKSHQIKGDTEGKRNKGGPVKKVAQRRNNEYSTPYGHHMGNFDPAVQKKRAELVKRGSRKHKNEHAGQTVREDYDKSEIDRRLGPGFARVKKLEYEAGSGSIPSGTNTNMPNWGKRKDGSSGPC